MAKGKGKPCGASYIAANKKCRVGLPKGTQNALTETVKKLSVKKAATLPSSIRKELADLAARDHQLSNPKESPSVEGLRKQYPDLNTNALKLARDYQSRQAADLSNPKYKLDLPETREDLMALRRFKVKQHMDAVGNNKKILSRHIDEIDAKLDVDLKAKKAKKNTLTREIMEGDSGMNTADAKSLAGNFRRENDRYAKEMSLQKKLNAEKSEIAQLQSVLGLGAKTRKEIGRDLPGLRNEAKGLESHLEAVVNNPDRTPKARRTAQVALDKVRKALAAGKTAASDETVYGRETSKELDDKIEKNITSKTGKADYDFKASLASGSKVLGSGGYGTVMQEPNGGNAVKRGDVSEREVKIIDKVGKAGLGPNMLAAQLNGPGIRDGYKNGRIAMDAVPGKPMGNPQPDKEINGVKVADAYWKARADLHRLGIAHNDMHGENILIGDDGKGKLIDMGLAQDSRKAALAEALGAFGSVPRQAVISRVPGATGDGDWQMRRWSANGGDLLARADRTNNPVDIALLNRRAPILGRAFQNKPLVWEAMRRDGFTNDDIATIMRHGIRSDESSYKQGPWGRMTATQAKKYINILYKGI